MAYRESYEEFVGKFNVDRPKTTDDCYTPQEIYEAIWEWLAPQIPYTNPVRPFYPGGDYESYDYSNDGTIVYDNPPFSIQSKIVDFYIEHDIPFFLFCNGLTVFNLLVNRPQLSIVLIHRSIRFQNGAVVKVAFVTNLKLADNHVILANTLQKRLDDLAANDKKIRPKHDPMIKNSAELMKYIDPSIKADSSVGFVGLRRKDDNGVAIFGCGIQITEDELKKLNEMKEDKHG